MPEVICSRTGVKLVDQASTDGGLVGLPCMSRGSTSCVKTILGTVIFTITLQAGVTMLCALQMRKLRHRKIKKFAQGS